MSKEFDLKIAELRPALRSLTYRFTRDREESLDLLQDTLLKALTYKSKFKAGTNLKGWLFTIMRNTFINQYRKTKRHLTLPDQKTVTNAEDSHTFNLPHESMEFKEVWRNVNGIREDLLIPFRMYLTGYKYFEIASHLKIPVGTVKNRIFNARKEIQKKLTGYRHPID